MGVYGLVWTQLGDRYRYRGTAVLLRYFTVLLWYFTVLLWYFNLILKAAKEPLEPERGAEAHELRRSADLIKKHQPNYAVTGATLSDIVVEAEVESSAGPFKANN